MSIDLVQQIISALAIDKNVLLSGPPGTGKTWVVSEVIARLAARGAAGGRPTLRLGSTDQQFGTAASQTSDEIPINIAVEWVTFHQSYSYEEFILGRRPKPEGSGIVLEPHFGLLMTLAVRVHEPNGPDGCLLIIDELNRANTSQVFGEFITLLDPEYRATRSGTINSRALKVSLPGVEYTNGRSEQIRMLRGGDAHSLPDDWTFPEHVYLLATMNSVDKAALPLDSALTRRFHRIEMRPNVELLASRLSVDLGTLSEKASAVRKGAEELGTLSPEETTILMLDRINSHIAADLGDDFEIGHSLVWPIVRAAPEARWSALAMAWDTAILPQIIDRYTGRLDALRDILKIEPGSETQPAFRDRQRLGDDAPVRGALDLVPLRHLGEAHAVRVLQSLAL
ncbi:AAA family ATPase [Sphingosinicella sp. BN140058]|uniref:AAA family ATPase n=1 Tax=Sphingosinicella sp. BN140058 TaxID=1892855 RepID=UPI0010124338|nr:AAA family ATPase [Sphingosinicella sp. BN140058]QAY78684.1 hypothetical protein ETR14_20675 [Sphingosinicella sp. BN140058]